MGSPTWTLRGSFHELDRRLFRGAAFPLLRALRRADRARGVRHALHAVRMSRQPIVLGGCARSGTTLLLSVLSSHPQVHAFPEETAALCPTVYAPALNLEAPLEIESLYRRLLDDPPAPERTRWCEKTPQNIMFARRILDFFGAGVRFVHIVRDGRDVVTSVHPHDPGRFWVEPSMWVRDVGLGRALEGHPRFKTVRYEDLVCDYELTVRGLCDFLELSFHPAMLDYPESATVQSSNAWFRPATQVHVGSTARWRRPELSARVQAMLDEPGAVQLLHHYGYLDAGSAKVPGAARQDELSS